MQEKYLGDRADLSSTNYYKASHDKSSSRHKSLSILQTELTRAESSIQSLLHEKDTLKSALSSSSRKKEELFKVLVDYKEAVEKLKCKNLELEKRLDEVNMVRSEIEKVRNQLTKRDEKIEFLLSRNQELEALVAELSSRLEKPKKKPSEPRGVSRALISNLETMVHKVKSNSIFHRLFKFCVPCINSFLELMQFGRFEEALTKMFSFSIELMKDYEKSLMRVLSPGLSEVQSAGSINGTMVMNCPGSQYEEVELSEEDRIAKLNSELKAAIVRSKEVLFNRSISNSQLKIDYSDISVRNNSGLLSSVSRHDRTYNSVESSKNLVTRIPKVEIQSKHGNKTAKIVPKPSILKRSN